MTSPSAGISHDIRRTGFAIRSGDAMKSLLGAAALADWDSFAASWDDLGPDLFMADGGRYRRRRFAAFAVTDGTIVRKPHQPHYQSRDYNALNGGIERWFEPVSSAVAEHAVTQSMLKLCDWIFAPLAPMPTAKQAWHVEMHQFRIEAQTGQQGRPTPEGPHRDGVEWVCVMLVARQNVSSGVTEIFDPTGRSLGQFTLTDPLETVFVDDNRVFHGVTPISPLDPRASAHRDVLVLTFRREG